MKRTKYDNINGWLVVDKPQGMGSTDAVNLTRRLLNANKNGHAGTLDPFATGLLPIAFGEATKLITFVTDGTKEYEFLLKFGTETNTGDTEGTVTAVSDFLPMQKDIEQILPYFIGTIEQIPPIYSAIKINGQRAYKLARAGEKIEMPPRQVEIYNLEILNQVSADSFYFRVGCSKGTYIRTLGQDIARKLGTCGHLQELRRTKCGIFTLKDKILLETLKNMVYVEERQRSVLPLETSLRDIAVIAVSEEDAAKLKQGQSISPKPYGLDKPSVTLTAAALCQNCLTALVVIAENKISPIRVFNL